MTETGANSSWGDWAYNNVPGYSFGYDSVKSITSWADVIKEVFNGEFAKRSIVVVLGVAFVIIAIIAVALTSDTGKAVVKEVIP